MVPNMAITLWDNYQQKPVSQPAGQPAGQPDGQMDR